MPVLHVGHARGSSPVVQGKSTVTLYCNTVDANTEVTWFFNGAIIDSELQSRMQITLNQNSSYAMLTINRFQAKSRNRPMHGGVYQCGRNGLISKNLRLSRASKLKRLKAGSQFILYFY